MKEFAQRFAWMPARIKERQEAWESLGNLHQTKLFVLHDSSESQLQVIKTIRACGRCQVFFPLIYNFFIHVF